MKILRRATVLGAAAALTIGGVLAAPSLAYGGEVHHHGHFHHVKVLHPGQSIQRAVNHARPGSTIFLKPGKYLGGVVISKPLHLIGSGPSTMLVPNRHAPKVCKGDGICIGSPKVNFGIGVHDVSVLNLQVSGFKGIGVVAFGVDGLVVSHIVANHDGEYGAAAFQSHDIRMTHNWTVGHGGEAGLYIGETAHADALLAGNYSAGWISGYFLRDSREGKLVGNVATRNCIGTLGLDTGKDRAGAQFGAKVPAGEWFVAHNRFVRNNRACPAGEENPPLSGHGFVSLGTDHYTVLGNWIVGNRASGPHAFPDGGVIVATSPFATPPRPTSYLRLQFNHIKHNALDVFWDGKGKGNVLKPNRCRTSDPAWICAH